MSPSSRFVSPANVIRAEHLALLALAITVYWNLDDNWWLFAMLFLAPDLSFAAAVMGPNAGVIAYNLAHTAVAPVILVSVGIVADWHLGISLATIWFAHLAFDRLVGYGLKYSLRKNDTHLDRF